MKNGKDRAKKEIKGILKNKWQNGMQLLIWMDIRDILKLHGLKSNFSYQEFERLFQTFQNICRVDFNKALEGFLSFFDSKTKTNNIPKISKIKVTKVKQERMPQWKLLKSAWDLLHKHDSQNYLSEDMQGLIMFKSFLLQCDSDKVKSFDKEYILHFYGISRTRFMKNSKLQEKVEKIHLEAEAAISYFRMMLKMIPWILKKYNPVATYCLIDVFVEVQRNSPLRSKRIPQLGPKEFLT